MNKQQAEEKQHAELLAFLEGLIGLMEKHRVHFDGLAHSTMRVCTEHLVFGEGRARDFAIIAADQSPNNVVGMPITIDHVREAYNKKLMGEKTPVKPVTVETRSGPKSYTEIHQS